MARDDERVERLIEQNYTEMVNRGEMSWLRSWTGELSKELVHSRPRLCIYEAQSHAWFGELDEADRALVEAEKRLQPEIGPSDSQAADAQAMLGHLAHVRSRVTAMRGDIRRAIELSLAARELIPLNNLGLQLDIKMTLGYQYFLNGDYDNASPILSEMIRSSITAGSIINPAAACCVMARLAAVQGLLSKSDDLYQSAAHLIAEASGQHLGAKAIVEVGMADVLCERNALHAALARVKQGLALMPWWGKADDYVLAYVTLARVHLAQANRDEAIEAVDKAVQLIQTRGVFSEARTAVEIAQVRLWLAQGNLHSARLWAASQEERPGLGDSLGFENELVHMTRARIFIVQNRLDEALGLLSRLEEITRSAGRLGRVIEILVMKALALQESRNTEHAILELGECLLLAEPGGYVRVFLDEGRPMQTLLALWLAHAGAGPLREYAINLLGQFEGEPGVTAAAQDRASPVGNTGELLSQRELEVLHLIALGRTNQEIAQQLVVAPGTVKAHTASIYRKLDAANRTEAVARARRRGILR
jgi:LuxR family transcriptional regulator, maltose regulon positive regulatory protein